jgi:OmcA/MtrC family decaheme c-type cytochrome
MGEELPSVLAGHPYQIIGFQNSVNDFSTVAFPQDIRHCTVCHASAKALQADTYLNKPTMAGCGSCHDRTWFGDPKHTPEGYENHPFDFEQRNDSKCAVCHNASGEGVAPIHEAHLTPQQRPEAPGLALDITDVSTNAQDSTLQITFTAKNGDGSPVTDLSDLDRVGAVVAWPAAEYQTAKSETIQGSTPPTGALNSSTSDAGTYVYTFAAKLPTGTGDTFAVAMTGRRAFEVDGQQYDQGTAGNSRKFFTLDGRQPKPRRTVIDGARCGKCHGEVRAHGEQRVGVDLCVMCHNPNATDAARRPADKLPPATIHFKNMVHRIHTGENLETGYVVYGFGGSATDFSEVRFPGDRRRCVICHVEGATDLPLPKEALSTVIAETGIVVEEIMPTRAACTSCHDGVVPNVHAILATGPAPDKVETCEVCHGPDAAFAVAEVHKMGN